MKEDKTRIPGIFTRQMLLLCLLGLVINSALAKLVLALGLPLYLDNIGSVLVAVLGGPLPGMTVGFVSNLINSVSDPVTMYYGILTVFIALVAALFSYRGLLKKWRGCLAAVALFVAIGGGAGSIMTWLLYGGGIGEGISRPWAMLFLEFGLPEFWAQFLADVMIDIPDKLITVFAVRLLLLCYPARLYNAFPYSYLYDRPETEGRKMRSEQTSHYRKSSVKTRILAIIVVSDIIIGLSSCVIGVVLNRQDQMNCLSDVVTSAAQVSAGIVDGEMIDDYLIAGESSPDYRRTRDRLEQIKNGTVGLKYLYVYQIKPDGCHVVFDFDSADTPAAAVGEIMAFDTDFEPYLETLLAGGEIPPVVSHGQFGALITAYSPIQNDSGETVAYACADVETGNLKATTLTYIIKMFAIQFGLSILIIAYAMWFAQERLVGPVNAVVAQSQKFRRANPEHWLESEDWQNRQPVVSGDEIEELYQSVCEAEKAASQNVREARHSKELEEKNRELAAATRRANEANRAKSSFLSRMSHDMRTPLNGMLGLAALMKDSVTDPKVLADLAQLELSGEYLLNLINDTLDVSRIETGKLELHPAVCDGKTIFESVIALAKPTIATKKLKAEIVTDGLSYPLLYIDVGRVEQIMMNILGNAVKFTPEGGTVTCTMKQLSQKDGVLTDEVCIRDTGIGMSPEFLPHLFEPFSQEDGSKKNARQGTGLGMIITKQLVELMGGAIKVESELGKGTAVTFTLVMPLATPEQAAAWQAAQKPEADSGVLHGTLAGKRVLLCEDHPLNAEIAIRLLQKKGVVTEHAENGQFGLRKFVDSPAGYYNAVLMDIRMPVMDGIETTAAIRALNRPDAKTVPIIAMTANAFEDDVHETAAVGMNAHLSKPIQPERLFATLEQLLCGD